MHQTDQYHVNNNSIATHIRMCVFFLISTTINKSFQIRSYFCFDFISVFPQTTLNKKRFIQLNIFCEYVKEKGNINSISISLAEREREQEKMRRHTKISIQFDSFVHFRKSECILSKAQKKNHLRRF